MKPLTRLTRLVTRRRVVIVAAAMLVLALSLTSARRVGPAVLGAAQTPVRATEGAAPIFGVRLPAGYRDWSVISVAHEAGNLNDLRAILGNDVAMTASRENTVPFPDGAIIARLAWAYVPSEENNLVFGRSQSFIAGSATNVQVMVKDSTKYAATGGWGFGQFKDGIPADEALHKTCIGCHQLGKPHDFVFTRYAR